MAETLLKLIEKYEGRIESINDYIDEHDPSTYTLVSLNNSKDCYQEIISDLQFLLNNPL